MGDLKNYLSTLMSAVSNSMLYEKGHSSIDDFTQRALGLLQEIHAESDTLEVMLIDEDVVVNKKPFREKAVQVRNLMKVLKRKGVSRLSFLKGVTFEEMKQMIVDLSASKPDLQSSPHIRIGVADIRVVLKADSDFKLKGPAVFTSEQMQKVRTIFSKIVLTGEMDILSVEETVTNIILNIKSGTSIVKLMNPVKAHDEYAFSHATNVSILSLSLSEALGFDSDMQRETGIAALLHDVGKLFIDRGLLEKNGHLAAEEWRKIQLHPVYGARYLARFEGVTRLAPIVAFEHHCRYDGKGYPVMHMGDRRQHICTQIIAIADCFDALRSGRVYRKSLDYHEVGYIIKNKSEGMFNPRLADIFIRIIHRAFTEQ